MHCRASSSDSRKRHGPASIRFPQPRRHRDSPITHTTVPLDPNGAVPLEVHARYTRREIQAAFGDGGSLIPPRWDSGVKWLADSKIDLFAFTLDKSSGDFSLTTSYRDYAISRDLIHWNRSRPHHSPVQPASDTSTMRPSDPRS